MTSIVQAAAVMKAKQLLEAVGAQFHIVAATGESFGAPIIPPAAPRKPRESRPSLLHLYQTQLDNLNAGDVADIRVPEQFPEEEKERLRKNAESYIRNKGHTIFGAWGKDNKSIEILRVT